MRKNATFIVGAELILIVFFIYFVKINIQLKSQDKYEAKYLKFKREKLSKSLATLKRNYSVEDKSSKHEANNGKPPSIWQPHPSLDREECLHYYKELYVKPVPEYDCNQPYVTVYDGGRLGNQVCQYGSLYLLRHLYGVRVSVSKPMKQKLSKVFKNIDLPEYDADCFTRGTTYINYDELFNSLYIAASQTKTNAGNNYLITKPLLNMSFYILDSPQPRDLILAHRDFMRSIFTFKDEVVQKAIHNIDAALEPFNASYSNRNFSIVTVHIRRTDYGPLLVNLYNVKNLDKLYFIRSFNFYRERLILPKFLVLSDDPTWCKNNLETKDVLIIASNSAAVDMTVMSLGDHHVTSYGTFSFSGAFLGYGHITHPAIKNKYTITKCVDSPFFHPISTEETHRDLTNSSNIILQYF